jgi:hypothetical protein
MYSRSQSFGSFWQAISIMLAAFLEQLDPQSQSLRINLLHVYLYCCGDPCESVDHQPDRGRVSQSGDRGGQNGADAAPTSLQYCLATAMERVADAPIVLFVRFLCTFPALSSYESAVAAHSVFRTDHGTVEDSERGEVNPQPTPSGSASWIRSRRALEAMQPLFLLTGPRGSVDRSSGLRSPRYPPVSVFHKGSQPFAETKPQGAARLFQVAIRGDYGQPGVGLVEKSVAVDAHRGWRPPAAG